MMLALSLLSLFIASSPLAVQACPGHTPQSPLLWLAELRANVAPGTEVVMTLNRVTPGMRLIQFEQGAAPIPITAEEYLELEKSGLRYIDVTEIDREAIQKAKDAEDANPLSRLTFPPGPTKQAQVWPVVKKLSEENLRKDLEGLTKYNNRYYDSDTGAQAAADLLSKLQAIAKAAPGKGGKVNVNIFPHDWKMPSIIARIEGTNTAGGITIAGAHLDSINQNDKIKGAAPGADDNGSGSVNLIEAFRKLVQANFKPTNPVEFHWYSAEEVNLRGSKAVADSYSKDKKTVDAYLNLDMTAWKAGATTQILFYTDYTSPGLTTFVKTLVSTYLTEGITTVDDVCKYPCSDHASWDSHKYPAVYPFEGKAECPYIHGPKDITNYPEFSFPQMLEFTKLVVAYVMELAL